MNLSLFIKKINSLEKSIKISEINYFDFNPWPYIRLKVLHKYTRGGGTPEIEPKKSLTSKFKQFYKTFMRYRKNPVKNQGIDIVYFTRTSESKDIIDQHRFNRYADSFESFFSTDYKIKTLEISDEDWVGEKEPINKDITSLDLIIIATRIKIKFLIFFGFVQKMPFASVNQEIEKNFGFQVDMDSELMFLDLLSQEFVKVLKFYQPKLVFLTVFYRLEAMAMSLACQRLGIKVVEYQHGAQNDYHSMYTHWQNIPAQGYELIPDLFWMWGNIPKERIDNWAKNSIKHKVVVGGNLWMTYLSEKEHEVSGIKEFYNQSQTHILISLQGDQFFPRFLIETIAASSNDIIWHFRDHPRLSISRQLRESIAHYENVEIDFSSQAPLYELLKVSDIHLTGYSTVAFEAQNFHVPTVFTHINALNGYAQLINKNGLFYAEDSIELMSRIESLIKHPSPIAADYILSDLSHSKQTLLSIMEKP
jgi:hypothetical protein